MKKNEKRIQIALLISGILLILFTYFYNPFMKKDKLYVEKESEENFPVDSDKNDGSTTTFEKLSYKGIYDLDKKFIVKSKKAHIKEDNPNIVYMDNMHVRMSKYRV